MLHTLAYIHIADTGVPPNEAAGNSDAVAYFWCYSHYFIYCRHYRIYILQILEYVHIADTGIPLNEADGKSDGHAYF